MFKNILLIYKKTPIFWRTGVIDRPSNTARNIEMSCSVYTVQCTRMH